MDLFPKNLSDKGILFYCAIEASFGFFLWFRKKKITVPTLGMSRPTVLYI